MCSSSDRADGRTFWLHVEPQQLVTTVVLAHIEPLVPESTAFHHPSLEEHRKKDELELYQEHAVAILVSRLHNAHENG